MVRFSIAARLFHADSRRSQTVFRSLTSKLIRVADAWKIAYAKRLAAALNDLRSSAIFNRVRYNHRGTPPPFPK